MNVKVLIQEKWLQGLAPVVNGILYADGKIVQIEGSDEGLPKKPWNETTLLDFLTRNRDLWASFTELRVIDNIELGVSISCGEGSCGGDGYVAAINSQKNFLLRMAYFDYSNPFIAIRMNGNKIEATNNKGDLWEFPLATPEFVIVMENTKKRN